MQAAKPENEEQRLQSLYRYNILDAPREEEFDRITQFVAQLCDVPMAMINLVDRDRQWFLSECGAGVRETKLNVSICAHAILQPGLFIVPDTQKDERFAANPLVTGDPRLRFYAGALLESSDGYPIGTLCLLDFEPRELSELQKNGLILLADQVMRRIELRRIVSEQFDLIVARRDAEDQLAVAYAHQKRIAETLQRSLLLDTRDMRFPRMDVVSFYEAAWDEAQVGGDFYDAFSLDSRHVALIVGDVAGKGLAAAARTAEVKYVLRAFLQEDPSPAHVLTRINNFLCKSHGAGKEEELRFVALALAVVDTVSGRVTLGLAGAEPAIVVRHSGEAKVLMAKGMALGISAGEEYFGMSTILEKGDVLLLTTDGLTEARHGSEFLDQGGLIALAKEALGQSTLEQMGAKIVQGAKDFARGSLRDDACLLLASCNPM